MQPGGSHKDGAAQLLPSSPPTSAPATQRPWESDKYAGVVRSRPILTSLPLQIFIYFGGWWDVLFWLVTTAVCIYKGGCRGVGGWVGMGSSWWWW